MKIEELKHTNVNVHGVNFKLMTYTRSLELCARMNYETENLDFIDTIKSGQVMYDLGACEGRFSIYASLRGIKVVSFEPEEKNFQVFKQNLELNAITENNLRAINAGVGEKAGKAILNIGQPWEGGHQKVVDHGEVRNDLNFNFVNKQEIAIVALDTFVEDKKNSFPNYLKIDIDGSELPFLRGAINTLKKKELKGMIFELNELDPNFGSIIELLASCGFKQTEKFNVPNEPDLFNFIFRK